MKAADTTDEVTLLKPLGILLLLISMVLLDFTRTGSLPHRLGIVALSLSVILLPRKRYMLVPCLLLLTMSILGVMFGYIGPLRIPIITMAAFAVAMAAYGWWRDRQAKAIAKRQTDCS